MKTIENLQSWILESEIEKFKFFGKIIPHFATLGDKKRVYILGDADGSFARIVLAALLSGFITLTPKGLDLLKILLQKEDYTLVRAKSADTERVNSLAEFQKDKEIYNAIDALLATVQYRKSYHRLICLGDLLFDRLINNLNANLEIIEKLYSLGVVFIKGNHDYLEAIDHEWVGYGAHRDKSKEDKHTIKNVIDKCYKLAYYDKEQNILYTHAALEKGAQNMIKYCHLEVDNSYANELADEINKIECGIDYEYLQDFRPGSNDYELQQGEKYIPEDFLHVHGHQDTIDSIVENNAAQWRRQDLKGVVGINARSKDGFMPVFICISY